MLKHPSRLLLAASILLAPVVHADDAALATLTAPVTPDAPPPAAVWKADIQLGYVDAATPTSKATSVNAKLHAAYTDGLWTHEANLAALSAESTDTATSPATTTDAESYVAGTKSRRAFAGQDYSFLQTQWDKDVQSQYKYQLFAAGGLGHFFLNSSSQQLSVELGVGARHSEYKVAQMDGGSVGNDGIGTLAGAYHWQINPAVSFGEKVDAQYGRTDLTEHSLTELKQTVTTALNFSLSFDVKHDTGGNTGPSATYRTTSFNVIYQLK